MGLLKRLFEFYINSSIHVSLAVCSLTWITLISFDLKLDKDLLVFIFFASVTGYNFIKYFGLAKFHHRRLSAWLKQIQIFSLFCFIGLGYYTFQLELTTLVYIAIFGAITFLYAIPFLPKALLLDPSKNLRAISGIKIYIIALVWAGITVVIPLVNAGEPLDISLLWTFIQRYLFIIIVTLPFEIRDMQFDSLKLATIPQKIGIGLTKKIGVLLLILFVVLEFLKNESQRIDIWILFTISAVTLLLLLFSKIQETKYYSSFWVEGVPVLWLLLMLF